MCWAEAHKKPTKPRTRNEKVSRHRAAVRVANARAKAFGVPGRLTSEQVLKAVEQSGGKCRHCGRDIADAWSLDHVKPMKRGGPNTPENISITCLRCNNRKGNKSLRQFKKFIGANGI